MFCSENFCDCCSLEKCKENKCADGKIICRKKAKAALERAHEIRKFEIDLLWKRTTYMSTFQAFLFAALGVSFSADNPELAVYFLRVIVCVVGMFSALFWFLMNKGSKFWYGNWENHIDFLEYEFEGNLHKTVLSRDGKLPFSVSKINISTSFMFFGTWCMLAVLFLVDFISQLICVFLQCLWAQYSWIFDSVFWGIALILPFVLLWICVRCCCGLHTHFRGVDKVNETSCNKAKDAVPPTSPNVASTTPESNKPANNGGTTVSTSSAGDQKISENKIFLVKQRSPDEIDFSLLKEVSIRKEICQFLFCRKCEHCKCRKCCKCYKSNCRRDAASSPSTPKRIEGTPDG